MKKTNKPVKHRIKKNMAKAAVGASVLHHSDWTIHGILDELTHHNGYLVADISLAFLLLLDIFFKRE